MMILAFLFPPLAVLLCGKPFQAIINLFLTLLYFPGMIHAVMVVSSHNADRRHKEAMQAQALAIAEQTAALTVAQMPPPPSIPLP